MEAITGGIAAIGNYLYQVGEALVVGTGNTLSTCGEGIVAVPKQLLREAVVGILSGEEL